MQELLLNKTHDENRQGEAFAPLAETGRVVYKHFYIESYGCAMNFADSEVVASILQEEGFGAGGPRQRHDILWVSDILAYFSKEIWLQFLENKAR